MARPEDHMHDWRVKDGALYCLHCGLTTQVELPKTPPANEPEAEAEAGNPVADVLVAMADIFKPKPEYSADHLFTFAKWAKAYNAAVTNTTEGLVAHGERLKLRLLKLSNVDPEREMKEPPVFELCLVSGKYRADTVTGAMHKARFDHDALENDLGKSWWNWNEAKVD